MSEKDLRPESESLMIPKALSTAEEAKAWRQMERIALEKIQRLKPQLALWDLREIFKKNSKLELVQFNEEALDAEAEGERQLDRVICEGWEFINEGQGFFELYDEDHEAWADGSRKKDRMDKKIRDLEVWIERAPEKIKAQAAKGKPLTREEALSDKLWDWGLEGEDRAIMEASQLRQATAESKARRPTAPKTRRM